MTFMFGCTGSNLQVLLRSAYVGSAFLILVGCSSVPQVPQNFLLDEVPLERATSEEAVAVKIDVADEQFITAALVQHSPKVFTDPIFVSNVKDAGNRPLIAVTSADDGNDSGFFGSTRYVEISGTVTFPDGGSTPIQVRYSVEDETDWRVYTAFGGSMIFTVVGIATFFVGYGFAAFLIAHYFSDWLSSVTAEIAQKSLNRVSSGATSKFLNEAKSVVDARTARAHSSRPSSSPAGSQPDPTTSSAGAPEAGPDAGLLPATP